MGRIQTRVSASLIAALLIASPPLSAADGAGETAPRRSIDLSAIDIDNFGRVNDNYYRGEQPDDRDYADLAALGIKTVVDLQADGDNHGEARLVEAAGMTFFRIPMTTHVPPTREQLSQFLEIVNDPARQPVYVHCKGGKHRTGVMSAVYRIEQDGWTPDRAFKEMKRYKFGWDFLHPEFKRFVYGYERGKVSAPAIAAQ